VALPLLLLPLLPAVLSELACTQTGRRCCFIAAVFDAVSALAVTSCVQSCCCAGAGVWGL
jgi:hypothetical protein